MPNPPSTDGLPVLLQIAVTLLFGVLSVAVLWRSVKAADHPHQSTTIAHLADMQPVRDLRDTLILAVSRFEQLCGQLHETEHHTRNHIEEMVRLRHAVERLTQSLDRWRAD